MIKWVFKIIIRDRERNAKEPRYFAAISPYFKRGSQDFGSEPCFSVLIGLHCNAMQSGPNEEFVLFKRSRAYKWFWWEGRVGDESGYEEGFEGEDEQ
jgi:hypothetical protein